MDVVLLLLDPACRRECFPPQRVPPAAERPMTVHPRARVPPSQLTSSHTAGHMAWNLANRSTPAALRATRLE